MERDHNLYTCGTGHKYFNSHAHVERDLSMNLQEAVISISTHTLTWSVTPSISFLYALILISTHTLTWSVTGNAGSKPCGNSNFNSHAHVERDWIKPATFPAAFYFNSHAHVERD